MTTQDRYGFTMSAILEEQSSFQLVPWLLSTGEDMESLGGEGTVKALSMLAHMVEKGYMPRDCINWSQVDVARQFAAGKCAMMENGPCLWQRRRALITGWSSCPWMSAA